MNSIAGKNNLTEQVKRLVGLNRTEQAIEETVRLFERFMFRQRPVAKDIEQYITKQWQQVEFLSVRLKALKKQASLGRIDDNFVALEKAKLHYSLIEIIKETSINYPSIEQSICNFRHFNWHLEAYVKNFIGREVNSYAITEYVGMGGFGTVFKAKHKYLNTNVAIKISHPILQGQSYISKIITLGINGLKVLDHKYIAKVFDVGEISLDKYHRIFLIMELIEGENLRDFCVSTEHLTQEDIERRIQIFRKICIAIAYSHNVEHYHDSGFQITGIKHGDIKPENILITPEYEPKIIDFMFVDLTKLYKMIVAQPEFILSQGYGTMMFGTYGYMAPEQAEGGIVTEQSDIYALGISLLEIFGHFFSFTRGNYITFNSSDEVRNVLSDEIIPDSIIRIIYRATQVIPENRYKSVIEIIDEIDNLPKRTTEEGKSSGALEILNLTRLQERIIDCQTESELIDKKIRYLQMLLPIEHSKNEQEQRLGEIDQLEGKQVQLEMEIQNIGTQLINVSPNFVAELPFALYRRIVDFLMTIPNIHDTEGQRAFTYYSGLDSQLISSIPIGKSTAQFVVLLVNAAIQYGKLSDGRNALEAIVDAAKTYVGETKKAYCTVLLDQIRANQE